MRREGCFAESGDRSWIRLERCESGRIGLPAKELYLITGTVGSNPTLSAHVPIAQVDRALDCGSKGRRFESSWARSGYSRRDARAVESGGLEIR